MHHHYSFCSFVYVISANVLKIRAGYLAVQLHTILQLVFTVCGMVVSLLSMILANVLETRGDGTTCMLFP